MADTSVIIPRFEGDGFGPEMGIIRLAHLDPSPALFECGWLL